MQQLNPAPELYGKILAKIDYERQLLKFKRRLVFYFTSLIGCLSLFVVLLRDFENQIANSGFAQMFGLLATDFSVIRSHLYDYVLSLVDALPVISFAFVAIAGLLALISIVELLKYSWNLKHLTIN